MSYSLFKLELKTKLMKQHDSKTKFAKAFADAYTNFANRHFEILSGGGKLIGTSLKKPALRAGVQLVMTRNLTKKTRINFFNDIEPYIKTFWLGLTANGPAGLVVITNGGVFKGPPVPENNSLDIFLSILQGVMAVHMLTMSGSYTNYYTGAVTPWSSATLQTIP